MTTAPMILKILLLGEIGVGKTSIARRLVFNSFGDSYKATIGVDIYTYDGVPPPAQRPLVFITGASSGIGQALALRYAQLGWRLALVARRGDLVRAWLQEQRLDTAGCAVYTADVRDADSVVAAATRCQVELGLPQVVIANAGISIGIDTAQREDLDVLADLMATNLLGLAATFHPFIRPMRVARRGTQIGRAHV